MAALEQSAEARAGNDGATRAVVVARNRARLDQPSREPLMITLGVVVLDVFAQEIAKVPHPEDHKVVEALGSNRPHETFRVWVAVRAARRNRHALDTARFEQHAPVNNGSRSWIR